MPTICIQPQSSIRQEVDDIVDTIDELNTLKLTIESATNFDIGSLADTDVITQYEALLAKFEGFQQILLSLLDAVNLDAELTTQEARDARKSAIALFEVTLSVADGLQCTLWETNNDERITEVYKAIQKTALAIGREMANRDNVALDDNYELLGVLQFIDSFGGLELRIANGMTTDSNGNPVLPVGYALTENANLILLWDDAVLRDEDTSRGYPLYTAQNLVHEFGHVLDIRTGNTMINEWEQMRQEFGELVYCGDDETGNPISKGSATRGFGIQEGWSVFENRENRLDFSDFNCFIPTDEMVCTDDPNKDTLCTEMELERIADMFLFWVYSDIVGYQFDINNLETRPQTRANALYAFSHGEEWTRNNITLTPSGFLNWVILSGDT